MDFRELDSTRCWSPARPCWSATRGRCWSCATCSTGIRRFDDLAGHLRIARNVLTRARRLAHLTDAGIVDRVPYREAGRRVRHEYRLTAAGRDLRPVILAMMSYGDRHLAGPDGPPMRVEHDGCGADVHIEVHCAEGHLVDPAERLRTVPGPGARVAG